MLANRSLVTIDDLSNAEIECIFTTADAMAAAIKEHRKDFYGHLSGNVLATLFYEPSTRTRLSFEAAMQRLGGGVISTWDVTASSVDKGESLADTVRVIGSYADAIILRHPRDGAARLAAKISPVPVINAGDGAHEHPTQTLCDLYTLRDRHGVLEGLRVALCGDLQHGRTVHSLAIALARFGAHIYFVPGEGKEIPEHLLRKLQREYHARPQRIDLGVLGALFGEEPSDHIGETVNAIYMTPTGEHQLALISDVEVKIRLDLKDLSIYITRLQKERQETSSSAALYPKLTMDRLNRRQLKDISILHPLPRVDEIAADVDADPRSLYFKQAGYGIPIRMSLLWHLFGHGSGPVSEADTGGNESPGLTYSDPNYPCDNENCITHWEPDFAQPEYQVVRDNDYGLRCVYCDFESRPKLAGNIESRVSYPPRLLDTWRPPVKFENVRFFQSSEASRSAGFKERQPRQDLNGHREPRVGSTWIDLVSAPIK